MGPQPRARSLLPVSERVYSDEVVLFYNRAKPVHWDGSAVGVEQLRGLTIGLPLGSAKTPLLEEAERRGLLKYEAGGDETGNLRKLAAGRIDAVDMVKGTGQWLISQRLDADEAARLATTAPCSAGTTTCSSPASRPITAATSKPSTRAWPRCAPMGGKPNCGGASSPRRASLRTCSSGRTRQRCPSHRCNA